MERENDLARGIDFDTRKISLARKICIVVVLILAMLPVITIPFILFVLEKPTTSKKNRDARCIIFLLATLAFVIIGWVFALDLLGRFSPPDVPFTFDDGKFWTVVQENLDVSLVVVGCTMATGIFLNRWAVTMLHHEESLFRADPQSPVNIWVRLDNIFRWKNERAGLRSGNETLLKVKNAGTGVAFLSLGIMILTPLMKDFDLMGTIDYTLGKIEFYTLDLTDVLMSALYIVVFGVPFVLANMLLWFYLGRAITYQGRQFKREGNAKGGTLMEFAGFITSSYSFIPLVFSVVGQIAMSPFAGEDPATGTIGYLPGVIGCLVSNIAALSGAVVITILFVREPRALVLDPKTRERKLERGILYAKREESWSPAKRDNLLKRWCLGFLVIVVIGISVLNGVLWFQATIEYAAMVNWYEWGFYFWLGTLLVAGPVILLFFLRNVYVRRLLMWYLVFVMLLLGPLVFTTAPFAMKFGEILGGMILGQRAGNLEFIDTITTSDRPIHVLMPSIIVLLSFMAFYVLKRKAIPIPIKTPKHVTWSMIRNLKAFITSKETSNRVSLTLGLFAVVLAGMVVTFEPPAWIELPRPAGHEMQVSFWDVGLDHPDEVLEVLGKYHIRIHGWVPKMDAANARRYAKYGVQVICHENMPETREELEQQIEEVDQFMDYWVANNLSYAPYVGFVSDEERMPGVTRFNESAYREAIEVGNEFIEHIRSRGFEMFSTQYLVPINDLLDGDEDVSINYFIPFSIDWNVSKHDWMIYRGEKAVEYSEPYEIFTYEWARAIKHFLTTIGGEEGFAKASMSIGVTSDTMPLYRGPGGLEEFINDVLICHAVGISEIKIFLLSDPQSSDNGFLAMWGTEGIERMMEALNTYESVKIPFKRRGTFLGNLKAVDNPTGSVFGLMYQDAWLDRETGWLFLGWLNFVVLGPLTFLAAGPGSKGTRQVTSRSWSPRGAATPAKHRIHVALKLALFALVVVQVGWFIAAFWDWNAFEVFLIMIQGG